MKPSLTELIEVLEALPRYSLCEDGIMYDDAGDLLDRDEVLEAFRVYFSTLAAEEAV